MHFARNSDSVLADKMREAEPSIFQDETYQVEESPEELSVLQSLPDDEE